MLCSALFSTAAGQAIRPVRDDVGFCWDKGAMKRLIEFLEKNDTTQPSPVPPVAAISPHDDYLYAGRIYIPLFRILRVKEAVIIGLTHGAVRKEIGDPQNILILDDYPAWTGLSGTVSISPLREILKDQLDASDFIVSNQAHRLEHSIEALLPFLQYYNPDVRITPIMVTAMPLERMNELSEKLAGIIGQYLESSHLRLGEDVVILISSDANHYGEDFNNTPYGVDDRAHTKAIAEESRLVRTYLTGDLTETKIGALTREIWETAEHPAPVLWCGRYSIPFGLLLSEKLQKARMAKPLTGRLLRQSDTYSDGVLPVQKLGIGLTAPFSLKHWVGFFSVVYY